MHTKLEFKSVSRWAEVTHPFHPRRHDRFKFLQARRISGMIILSFQDSSGGVFTISQDLTDLAESSTHKRGIVEGGAPLSFCIWQKKEQGQMPRLARLDAPGISHHIMIRGIESRSIFRAEEAQEGFLEPCQCFCCAMHCGHVSTFDNALVGMSLT